MSEVEITTDGSCLGNPGPGGWACILRCGQHERVLQGGVADTTNNRMELIAAIEGLRALKRASQVTVLTDSEYVRRGITEFLPRWKANGWRAYKIHPPRDPDKDIKITLIEAADRVVPRLALALVLGLRRRRHAFEAAQQVFLGHAVDGDFGVVGLDAAGAGDQR